MERVKILIIEDDRHIADGLQFLLEKEGYEVRKAMTAAEGKEQALSGAYQLLLLDISLPDGNGFELFRELKRQKAFSVIFLTAIDEEEEIVRAFDLGADEYITKPFRTRELISRIRNVLRHAETGKTNEIVISNVKINTEQGIAYKNEERLDLTALEYKLLVMLFENKGRILTRTQILAGIWDEAEAFVNDNTLTVYIKRLREKIEDNPNAPKIIKTVRGMGYEIGV